MELGVVWDVDLALIQDNTFCAHPLIRVEFPHVYCLQGFHHRVVKLSALLDSFHEDGLFTSQGDSLHCSQLEHLQGQQGEVHIVICSSWVIHPPRQGIRSAHLPSRLVGQDEVKPGEV